MACRLRSIVRTPSQQSIPSQWYLKNIIPNWVNRKMLLALNLCIGSNDPGSGLTKITIQLIIHLVFTVKEFVFYCEFRTIEKQGLFCLKCHLMVILFWWTFTIWLWYYRLSARSKYSVTHFPSIYVFCFINTSSTQHRCHSTRDFT